jgi:hypothetical protein
VCIGAGRWQIRRDPLTSCFKKETERGYCYPSKSIGLSPSSTVSNYTATHPRYRNPNLSPNSMSCAKRHTTNEPLNATTRMKSVNKHTGLPRIRPVNSQEIALLQEGEKVRMWGFPGGGTQISPCNPHPTPTPPSNPRSPRSHRLWVNGISRCGESRSSRASHRAS